LFIILSDYCRIYIVIVDVAGVEPALLPTMGNPGA